MNSKLVSGVTEFLNTEGELREVIFKLLLVCVAVVIVSREQGRSNNKIVQKLWSLCWSRRPNCLCSWAAQGQGADCKSTQVCRGGVRRGIVQALLCAWLDAKVCLFLLTIGWETKDEVFLSALVYAAEGSPWKHQCWKYKLPICSLFFSFLQYFPCEKIC